MRKPITPGPHGPRVAQYVPYHELEGGAGEAFPPFMYLPLDHGLVSEVSGGLQAIAGAKGLKNALGFITPGQWKALHSRA